MKRQLMISVVLITLIFSLSGFFVYKKLQTIAANQKLAQIHQEILDLYLDIGYEMTKVQLEIDELFLGDDRSRGIINQSLHKSEDMLSRIRDNYRSQRNEALCKRCHGIPRKVEALDKKLDIAFPRLRANLDPMAGKNDSLSSLEKRIEEDIKEIAASINNWSLVTREMNIGLREGRKKENAQSRYLIVSAIVLSFVLSLIILMLTQRAIVARTRKLAEGLQKAAIGNYDIKIDPVSNDELGVLARNFNYLVENLKKTTQERDVVTLKLRELNSTLELRISQNTEKLRIAHENLVRTEGLAVAGTFASRAAHDLSSPLSTLAGYCELVNRKVPEEFGVASYCHMMEREIEKCMRILTGMLDNVRTPDDEKSLIDVSTLITELLLFIGMQAQRKDVSIKDNLNPQAGHIMANPIGLRQVFMNIIVNALEAMPHGGELSVSTSAAEDGREFYVIISDTGHGIPESDKEKIFDPFYTTKKSGTGLGLPISYGIIKNHGGNISIRSELGKGTTFIISLPMQDRQAKPTP